MKQSLLNIVHVNDFEREAAGRLGIARSANKRRITRFVNSKNRSKIFSILAEECSGGTRCFPTSDLSMSFQNSRGSFLINRGQGFLKNFDFTTTISLRTLDLALLYTDSES